MEQNINPVTAIKILQFAKGQMVNFIGKCIFKDSTTNKSIPIYTENYEEVKILDINKESNHPYKISFQEGNIIGWADECDLEGQELNLQSVSSKEVYLGMKYFKDKVPFVCLLNNSTIYKKNQHIMPKGIVWNSTGENKPYLRNYIQPYDNNPEVIKELGLNDRGSDYNHTLKNDGYHAWIGLNNKKEVISVQTLPWTWRAAGCGYGEAGSADDGWIQINICEGALNDKKYFSDIYNELTHLTAYLCELFDINPYDTVILNNFSTEKYPTIMDHSEAAKYGIASPRQDVFHWFKRHNTNMRKARETVVQLIANTITPSEQLNLVQSTDINMPNVLNVKVNVNKLNVRSGPGIEYEVLYIVTRDTFFVVEQHDGWGHIVGEDGWIDLKFVERLDGEPLE